MANPPDATDFYQIFMDNIANFKINVVNTAGQTLGAPLYWAGNHFPSYLTSSKPAYASENSKLGARPVPPTVGNFSGPTTLSSAANFINTFVSFAARYTVVRIVRISFQVRIGGGNYKGGEIRELAAFSPAYAPTTTAGMVQAGTDAGIQSNHPVIKEGIDKFAAKLREIILGLAPPVAEYTVTQSVAPLCHSNCFTAPPKSRSRR